MFKVTWLLFPSRTKGERSITQKMSAVCAALKYKQDGDTAAGADADPATFDLDADMEAGSGSGALVEDDPQWILFNHVKVCYS